MDDLQDNNADDAPAETIARSRSRREKKDRTGRFAAMAKFREAKKAGERVKYEMREEEDVYEEVDESEYSKIVRDRQEDDWIIDDDGAGYVEDGREIFDEEDDIIGGEQQSKGKKGASNKRKQNPNIRAPDSKPKSIKSMFAAQAVKSKPKKPEKQVNLKDDDFFGDIMSELQHKPSPSIMPPPVPKLKKKTITGAAAAKPSSALSANPFSTSRAPASGKRLNPVKVAAATALAPVDTNLMEEDDSPRIDDPQSQDSDHMEKSAPVRRPRPVMRTALDSLEEEIEEIESQKEKDASMDVSGIDFDDDFEEENMAPEDAGSEKKVLEEFTLPEGGTAWETVKGGGGSDVAPVEVMVDSSALPLVTDDSGDQVLRMFWMDAYEDMYKQPGVVYLFGKVWIESAQQHVSCCVAVRSIERKVFLLPRKHKMDPKTGQETDSLVTFVDVYQEFNNHIAEKFKILKFKSRKVNKEYAFEKLDVPAESEYLEVRYSAELPALPNDLQGECFSHVFGTNTSSLEILVIDRKLKGPGWVDIKLPQLPSPPVSWCKVEAFVNRPDHLTVLSSAPPPPPLVVMTLTLRTLPNPRTHQNEVVGAACLVQTEFYTDRSAPKPPFQHHFCAITKPNDCIFPFDFKDKVTKQSSSMKVEIMGTERALLGFLLAKVHKVDPDVIVGHDILAFDLDVLLHRIQQQKIPHWSRIGRLKRATMPKLASSLGAKNSAGSAATCGRLVCDLQISAKELIRCRSYDLTELVSHVLKEKRREVDPDNIRSYYSQSVSLLQLVELTLLDASFVLRLMYELMVLPLAAQITNICGNIMARTLLGGRAERNEYLLLHAFTEKNFIVPDKASWGKKGPALVQAAVDPEDGDETVANTTAGGKKQGKRKPAYAGGLVLDPKKGFYDKFILLLDFNSLYPSIIQEYNICFTTINRTAPVRGTEDSDDLPLELPDGDLDPGILPTEIRKLVQSRRQVKAMMKEPGISNDLLMQYDIRQKALKLTANSMYGCLGFSFSRFYARPLAALVTSKGREILLKTRDLVQNMNLDVIYGDTDSIMVNTNSNNIDEVFKLGNKIKSEVNRLYRLLEIDIDGVFRSMLLLKKKKYAALTVTKVGDQYVTARELKGLDIVRRDWCGLAKEVGEYAVGEILSGKNREEIVENIHTRLQDVAEKVKNGDVPVESYHITKSLTKNPEDYPDKKSLPHVQVALRLNSGTGKKLRAGDTVYYVVCDDGSSLPHSQRAYSPDELAKSDTLKIDTRYYLSQQVHPVVARLCDPIDGTDAAHIAECLGLDPSGYRQTHHHDNGDEDEAMLAGGELSEEEKYSECERVKIVCPVCGKEIILDGVFTGTGSVLEAVLAKCPGPECSSRPAEFLPLIMNRVTSAMRGHIRQYYEGWLRCEDSACHTRTRKLPLTFQRGHPICQACQRGVLHPEYTDSQLYNQLCFYQYIFDLPKALSKENTALAKNISAPYAEHYKQLKSHVDRRIRQSAYSEVNLSRLFDGLFSFK